MLQRGVCPPRMALLVSSVPLSLRNIRSLPRTVTKRSSSRATRPPESEVWGAREVGHRKWVSRRIFFGARIDWHIDVDYRANPDIALRLEAVRQTEFRLVCNFDHH